MVRQIRPEEIPSLARALTPEEIGLLVLTGADLRPWTAHASTAKGLADAGLLDLKGGLYRVSPAGNQVLTCLLAQRLAQRDET